MPQPQLKSLIIPPDPLPVYRPFPEAFATEVPNDIATETPAFGGDDLTTESGNNLIWESQDTPLPDPNNPALYPPGS